MLTACWLNVICINWAERVNQWPFRCKDKTLFSKRSLMLTHIIKNLFTDCRVWGDKIRKDETRNHEMYWIQECTKGTVSWRTLHIWSLKYEKSNDIWRCLNKYPTVCRNKNSNGRWTWSTCGISFCTNWVIESYRKNENNEFILLNEINSNGKVIKNFNREDQLFIEEDEVPHIQALVSIPIHPSILWNQ